jgi:glycerol kinase
VTDRVVLAIDQGTTSTRALAFDAAWRVVASADRRLTVRHPRPDWAEQDPLEILDSVVATVAEVLDAIGGVERVVAVGLDNQGETALAWDAVDGRPLAPAVLWHCRRSEPIVARLAGEGRGPAIRARTGLPLDPYFSAGKWRWMFEELPEVREAAGAGRLCFGTVDAWLTARLGDTALTDPSTASRTQLLDLASLDWDPQLIDWFGIPAGTLPAIVPSTGTLALLRHPSWNGELPLTAMLCDQQAALAGHGAFEPGSVKATYGTGVFVLATAGADPSIRADGLLTTVAWSTPPEPATYAIDGGVFSAGSMLDWLASIGVVADGADADRQAASVSDAGGVRVLPALGGLAAPWWDGKARGVISGVTAASTPAHIARAAFDAIAQRVADIVDALTPALPTTIDRLRVDGGLTRSEVLVQRQADLLGIPVEVAELDESTALGVAQLAAVGAGEITLDALRALDRPGRRIEPRLPDRGRRDERAAWRRYVEAARSLTSSSIVEGQPERSAP